MKERTQDTLEDLRWKCPHCNALLGIIDRQTRNTVRIKIRESFYWVVGADEISTACRRCGAFCQIANKKQKP